MNIEDQLLRITPPSFMNPPGQQLKDLFEKIDEWASKCGLTHGLTHENLHEINQIKILATITFGIQGTPRQRGTLSRITNPHIKSVKRDGVGEPSAANIESYIKRKFRI